jgi:hypothetical protein
VVETGRHSKKQIFHPPMAVLLAIMMPCSIEIRKSSEFEIIRLQKFASRFYTLEPMVVNVA